MAQSSWSFQKNVCSVFWVMLLMITHLKWMQSLLNTLKRLQKAILFILSGKMG